MTATITTKFISSYCLTDSNDASTLTINYLFYHSIHYNINL